MLLQLRGLSPITIDNYRHDLHELATLTDALAPPTTVSQLTHFHIRRFASQLHSRGQNPRSIARKLSAWRGFFRWLGQEGIVTANPVDGIKAPRRDKSLPKALSIDDAMYLVRAFDPIDASIDSGIESAGDTQAARLTQSQAAARQACDQAMFTLLYSSGLRVSELAQLDVRHQKIPGYESAGWLDLDGAEVTVTGKGSKMRSVPVGKYAIGAIRQWLALRGDDEQQDCPALFLTTRGTRVSPRTIQLRLKAHTIRTGIAANVHPHVLRHSFASHLLQSSGDLRAVQELMGHASITSTQVYTSLDFQHLSKVYDAAHPRAKKNS